jgi:hypothetical protein
MEIRIIPMGAHALPLDWLNSPEPDRDDFGSGDIRERRLPHLAEESADEE